MKWFKILAWGCILVFRPVFAEPLHADEVSRTAPEIYGKKLAPLLTPLEEVLHLDDQTLSPSESGAVLLDEEIEYMQDDGRRFLVKHQIYRARTEAGAKQIEEDISSYRKGRQHLYLVLARTILPDGSQQEVRPNAAILQTPQREADKNIYQDREELRLIFPSVKAGSATECIVLIEEDQFRMPGEFSSTVSWVRGWPLMKMRSYADLPDSYAKRLKTQSVGTSVPVATVSTPEAGRKRFVWETKNVPAVRHEDNGALLAETGPVIYMTTLPDWDSFAGWYDRELKKSGSLSPKMTALADEWTKDLKDPVAIEKALLEKVANDVRYTGMTFGDSDLRPHTCEEVWDNQYGDCKDKSNLLVALLRYKGIDASLVLLNTEESGTVERRSPDFRDFDHAIVAIGKSPGNFVFSDPTIGDCTVGMISPSSADRDVLVIQDGRAVWTHTPPTQAGLLDYQFDLNLTASGELAGWLTFQTDGYYGAYYSDLFRELDKNESRSKVNDFVDNFYPGSEVVDFEVQRNRSEGSPFKLRIYFTVNGNKQNESLGTALSFPNDKNFFADVGENIKRRTSYFQWTDKIRVNATIHLPPGWASSPPPQPYLAESKPFAAKASWTASGDTCTASLELSSLQSVIPAPQFDAFRKSTMALRSWLSKPLNIVSAGTTPPPKAQATLDNFPVLPSGEGQLDWVDHRYPPEDNAALRVLALQKVLELFPKDPATLFSAQVKLAAMDLEANKPRGAYSKVTDAVSNYGKDVDPDTLAWAEYVKALACLDQNLDEEALKTFSRLAAQEKLKPYRRGWSSYKAGILLKKNHQIEEAKAMFEQAVALLEETEPVAMAQLAEIDYATGPDAFNKRLQAYLAGSSNAKDETVLELCSAVQRDYFQKHPGQSHQLAALLNSEEVKSVLGQKAQDAVKDLLTDEALAALGQKLQDQLKNYLKKNPWSAGVPDYQGKMQRDVLAKVRDEAQQGRKAAEASQRAVDVLTLLPVSDEYPHDLWCAALSLEWKDRMKPDPKDVALFNYIISLLDQLPSGHDDRLDGRFLQASFYKWRDQPDKELSELLHIGAMPELPETFRTALYSRLGNNYERSAKLEEALTQYKKLEPLLEGSPNAANSLLHAVYINLENNHQDEALRLIGLLSKVDADTLNKTYGAYYIREFIKLADNPQSARTYWAIWPKWWPQWQACLRQAGQKAAPQNEITFPEEPLPDIGADAGAALARKNAGDYWTEATLVAHGAKWLPPLSFELNDILGFSAQLHPGLKATVRALGLALFENYPDDNSEAARRVQALRAALYYDNRQLDKMKPLLLSYFIRNTDPSDEISQAMMRLQALYACDTGENVAEASQSLEKIMASPVPEAQRALNACCLGMLYSKAGQPAKEKALLEKELLRPEIAAVPDQAKKLRDRLTELGRSSDQSGRFTGAVSNWLRKNPLPWLQWTKPEKLDAVKSANLAGLLENPGKQFTRAEQIKLHLLICQDEGQSLDLKTDAWDGTFDSLMTFSSTYSEANAYIQGVLQDETFPESVRSTWLWYAIYDAWKNGEDYETYAKDPLARTWNAQQTSYLETWRSIAGLDYSSPASVQSALQKLTTAEMNKSSLDAFRHIFNHLLDAGDLKEAEEAYRLVSSLHLSQEITTSPEALQIELIRGLKPLRLSHDLHQSLAATVLKYFPADGIIKPAVYDDLRNRRQSEILDPKTALACILYEIKEGDYPREDLQVWGDFLNRLLASPEKEKMKIAFEIAETALQKAPNDDWRAQAVRLSFGAMDPDDSQNWARWEALVNPYKDGEKWPETNASIRLFELKMAIRQGQNVDLNTALAPLQEWLDADDVLEVKLSQAWCQQDRKTMRSLLEKMTPDELLQTKLIRWTLPSLEWTGMKDEAEIAREKARADLQKKLSLSSLTLSTHLFYQSMDLAEFSDSESLIPDGWAAYSISRIKDPRLLLGLQIGEARRSKNWEAMEKFSSQAVQEFPNYYHFYWDQGLALMQNGKKKEARNALETYTRYSKNETDYPEAMRLLRSLSEDP